MAGRQPGSGAAAAAAVRQRQRPPNRIDPIRSDIDLVKIDVRIFEDAPPRRL